MKEWLGVDFDGTMAKYDGWRGHTVFGNPIHLVVNQIKEIRSKGHEVRIFTARCYPIVEVVYADTDIMYLLDKYGSTAAETIIALRKWSEQHIGEILPITCVKDFGMSELWDDRAVGIEPNKGIPLSKSRRGYF